MIEDMGVQGLWSESEIYCANSKLFRCTNEQRTHTLPGDIKSKECQYSLQQIGNFIGNIIRVKADANSFVVYVKPFCISNINWETFKNRRRGEITKS